MMMCMYCITISARDRQTDRRPAFPHQYRASVCRRARKRVALLYRVATCTGGGQSRTARPTSRRTTGATAVHTAHAFFISQVKKLLLVSSAARWPDCCRRRLCSIHWRCSVRILAKSDPHHPQICTDAELEPVPKRRSLTRRPYRTDPDVECLETQIQRGIVY